MTQKMTDFERIKGWNEKSPKRISSCSRRSEAYSIYPARDWSIFGSYWPVYRHCWLYHWIKLLCPVILCAQNGRFTGPAIFGNRMLMTSNDLPLSGSCQQLTVNFWNHPVQSPCTSIPMHWLMFYHQRQTHPLQCWVLMKSPTFHTGTVVRDVINDVVMVSLYWWLISAILVVWTLRNKKFVKPLNFHWLIMNSTSKLVLIHHVVSSCTVHQVAERWVFHIPWLITDDVIFRQCWQRLLLIIQQHHLFVLLDQNLFKSIFVKVQGWSETSSDWLKEGFSTHPLIGPNRHE